MPKYEIEIDDASGQALEALAAAQRKPIPEVLRDIVLERLRQPAATPLSREFVQLVDQTLTDNEPVLRRFA
ncbi:MAG: hypothetical protein GX774_08870 [Armatimonadetes bacterium]|jgi:hypothetical protein|nr:hypothetical protein [Armatimonadota bacterium]